MRILLVGSGAREHALAWKIAKSPLVTEQWCAPGNPGIEAVAKLAPVAADDVPGLVALAREKRADLVVVGPERPLTLGLADALDAAGIPVFGPTKAAATVEGSKAFAKELMAEAAIPTAEYATFKEVEPALEWARPRQGRVVVKADGLAAGKGVVVCGSMEEARAALEEILVSRVHGEAGQRVVVEERLEGPEASFICLSDGKQIRLLAHAQDHKRIFDGDQGPNTGGMGAYSPAAGVSDALAAEVEKAVLLPAVRALRALGAEFRGALYGGLMLTAKGPRCLEFNARFGDPETQPVLMRLRSDLVPALLACARGDLSGVALEWDPRPAVGVVLAAAGYPGKVVTGDAIELPGSPGPDAAIFHAGTARDPAGRLVTSGGRVLTVCALGATVADARARAYALAGQVRFRGCQYRKDIAARAV
jgi:phosphoribosylamine--glycine ligase